MVGDAIDSHRLHFDLEAKLAPKLFTYYVGLYELNRILSCFWCFIDLLKILLNVQYILNLSHPS